MNSDDEIYMDDREKLPTEDVERLQARLQDAEGNDEEMAKLRAEMQEAERDFNEKERNDKG